ncbi:MAG: FAD:protein FMN transferase, partial [Gemmatimonadetes bacterium]|nr:FAD:protein FMN transferase [Gemmatimonadota bacterium]
MPITLATHAMGTRFELVLAGDDPHRLRAVGESALREVTECHQRFNLFDPGSWLNTINRRAADGPVALDGLTFGLLDLCKRVHDDSCGAFDITVAPLMHAWGFHTANGSANRAAIRKARNHVGMRHVQLERETKTVRFTRPGVALDLGAVAKGFAIDLAIELLREHGITCALLHGGTSTAAAIGSPPGEDGWRVRVRRGIDDQSCDRDITVLLKDSALSVSAPHGRVIESDGETLGHVLDPRTAGPAPCGAFAAAVGKSACLTDAWSTALLVLGERPNTMP